MSEDKKTVEPQAPTEPVTAPNPEPAVQPAGQPADDKTGFNQPEYTRKMQERTALKAEREALDTRAVEKGFDSHADYLSHIESRDAEYTDALAAYNEGDPDTGVTKKDFDALSKKIEETNKELGVAREQNVTMMMNFQHDSYSKTEKAKEYGFSKTEIDDFLKEPETGASVYRSANREREKGLTPNFYLIAARMMNREKTEAELLKQGADAQAALEKEKAGTATMTGTAAPPGEKKTLSQVEADRIAPDRRQKF